MIEAVFHHIDAFRIQQARIDAGRILSDCDTFVHFVLIPFQTFLPVQLVPYSHIDAPLKKALINQHPRIYVSYQLLFSVSPLRYSVKDLFNCCSRILIMSAHDDIRSFFRHFLVHALVHIRFNPVIAVHVSNVCTPCCFHAGLSCTDQASVFSVYCDNPGIFFPIFLADIRTPVCGAVVYQNDFQIRVCLAKDTLNTLG
ncbi:hypothetical protein IMSAGC007_01991 [Lachnospiraceae bacterium]|nr:hypothetical protein IMSAGC007_01991 [Lachnospiraceae bacterium]